MTNIPIAVSLKESVVHCALDLGFDLVRVTSAEPFVEDGEAAQERMRDGFLDGMPWFTRERAEKASAPQSLLPGARSIIAVALSYLPPNEAIPPHSTGKVRWPEAIETLDRVGGQDRGVDAISSSNDALQRESSSPSGKVARYAQWSDYHQVMKEKLRILSSKLPEMAGCPVQSRVFVDDGPLFERAVARRAGLGWFGKNTNILTTTHGSWVFLGALIIDLELEPDEPLKKNCGDCVRCIPACPTEAIVAPYVIDARRCISYLTIECRGPIPRHLRPLVGDWVFGCDLCQEVCPVNNSVPAANMPVLQHTGFSAMELAPLLSMTHQEFSTRFRNTPIKRAKIVGLKRNACVALGNIGDQRAVPVLGKTLVEGEPLVRGHAAWALGRIGGAEAQRLLQQALDGEAFAEVREEMEAALVEAQARDIKVAL